MIAAEKPEAPRGCEWPNCARPAYARIGWRWYCGAHALKSERLQTAAGGQGRKDE